MKKIFSVILIMVLSLTLVACGNNEIKKYIQEGKTSLQGKEYDKAMMSFKTAIDQGSKDEEVLKLYEIIKSYLEAEKAFEAQEYEKTGEILNNIDETYTKYSIKEEINNLKVRNGKELEYVTSSEEKFKVIDQLIKDKKYGEADTLVKELEKRQLTKAQDEKLVKLKEEVEKNKETIKSEETMVEGNTNNDTPVIEDKVEKEENTIKDNTIINDNGVVEETVTEGNITADKAVELVKKYLSNNGEYTPSIVRVDNEDDTQYVVHCYDIIDDGNGTGHTATSGWYYVNKSNGNVTSMF